MASTYSSLNYHFVFSTKNRVFSIEDEWIHELHAYMGGIVRGLGGVPLQVGGIGDHVHLLVRLKPTHCVSNFMRDLKTASSKWVHDEKRRPLFDWQEGYGSFTIGVDGLARVEAYIRNQAEHHLHICSKEELRVLLAEAMIEIEERYFE